MAGKPTGRRGGAQTKTPGGLVRTVILLPEHLYAELRRRAFEEGISQSEVCRQALTLLFEDEDED